MGSTINATTVALAAAAPAIGSFVAAAADRVPRGETVIWERSKCRSCTGVLAVRDLVPIVSFMLLRGRCRACGDVIPKETFVAEWTCLSLTIAALLALPPDRQIVGVSLTWALFALSWFDVRHWRLPNLLTVSLAALGLLLAACNSHQLFVEHVVGAAVGYAAFAALGFSYRVWRGVEGLGGGDVKLAAAAGAWVGWYVLPWILLMSSVGALLFAIASGRAAGRDRLPFGPFLAAASWVAWVWL